MKKMLIYLLLFSTSILFAGRGIVIEDFEDDIFLEPYPEFDLVPDGWIIDSLNTYNEESENALLLYYDTSKTLAIDPIEILPGTIWQIAFQGTSSSNIQAFGISDGINELRYSLFGNDLLDIESWVPHNQGAFPQYEWNLINFPIADDWLAWYGELPTISNLIFINHTNGEAIYLIDNIIDITEDLPLAPEVTISYEIGVVRNSGQSRDVDVHFFAEVDDPDSDSFSFNWQFGDSEIDTLQNPTHNYIISDDHEYTVFLEVRDYQNNPGYATTTIEIDEGDSNLPLTINFVGDIMIGRNMNNLFDEYGSDYIFEPTYDFLGGNADLTVANLEIPLTESNNRHPTKTIAFKSPPWHAEGLANAGIDLVTLANNHILDYMEDGIIDTQNTLDTLGILHSGAGLNSIEAYEPIFINKKGINIAFLASSDRTGQYNNYQPYLQAAYDKAGFAYQTPYYVQKQIENVENISDLIIVESHSGSEYSSGPGNNYDSNNFVIPGSHDENYYPFDDIPHMWDRDIRHFMIDAGADAVIVHHPHILHGFEIYKKKLIAHSLGNFIFDLGYFETYPTVILDTNVGLHGFEKFTIQPAFIDSYVTKPATGTLGYHILKDLAQKSKALNTYLDIDIATMTAEIIIDTLAMEQNNQIIVEPFDIVQTETNSYSNPIELSQNGYIAGISRIYPGSEWIGRVGTEKVWFGNMETEGCENWNINSDNEWYDEEISYEGQRSICVRLYDNSGDNYVTNLDQRVRINSGKSHTLQGYIKTENGADASIEIKYYSSRTNGSALGTDDVGTRVFGDTGWTYYFADLNVPEDANFFDLRLSNAPADSGDGYAWFDKVGLIEWENWEEQYDLTEIVSPNSYSYLQLLNPGTPQDPIVEYVNRYYHTAPPVASDTNELQLANCDMQNYPNPFYPNSQKSAITTIKYSAPKNLEKLELSIYNIKGQKIKTYSCQKIDSNWQNIIWDGKDNYSRKVASGVYFYQLRSKDFRSKPAKMLLLK